ncbi:MAG: ATP-binding cassette domain-containing protein [Oceanospirillaceae bacterium]
MSSASVLATENEKQLFKVAPSTAETAIKLSCKNLWKVYGDKPKQFFEDSGRTENVTQLTAKITAKNHLPAAIDVSFDVHVGEIFVIMGLSGSGKSTVIRCLSRLVDADSGQVLLDGEDLLAKSAKELIEIRRHKMGMVFQNFGLLPNLTVLDNICFPLKLQKIPLKERLAKAQNVIDLVGLKGRENSYPKQLSGGQQQRVGIARSLIVEPDVWFLDEPFSALDPLIRKQMQDEFLRIQKTLHKSIVFITHDFLEALRIADRIAIMRDGKIVQIDTPQALILNPVDEYVAKFTQEVPRIKILQAHQCMQAIDTQDLPANPSLEAVAANMPLEALIAKFSTYVSAFTVVDQHFKAIGIVTPRSIIQALADTQTQTPAHQFASETVTAEL